MSNPWLCRECDATGSAPAPPHRCPQCQSPRLISHAALFTLGLAHLDADAFFAAIEKRDRPELASQPVIVGGGRRGVVSTCCYIARQYGVRSAMPMFKALARCPDAVVLRPDIAKYSAVGRALREKLRALTPLVEPVSIDEAFLDLTGTERLHGQAPAVMLSRLARDIEAALGITVSIGLSSNKMLAKMASDRDKPRGFSIIGPQDAAAFLAPLPVEALPGIGKAAAKRLHRAGMTVIADLRRHDAARLAEATGLDGHRLLDQAWGRDSRPVSPERETKSISSETTFSTDIADPAELAARLWPLCETVARRLHEAELAAGGVTLKLRRADFSILTRHAGITPATQLAAVLFDRAQALLRREADGAMRYRLIGVGADHLTGPETADQDDLIDSSRGRLRRIEAAIGTVRERFGAAAIGLGRGQSPQSGPSSGDKARNTPRKENSS